MVIWKVQYRSQGPSNLLEWLAQSTFVHVLFGNRSSNFVLALELKKKSGNSSSQVKQSRQSSTNVDRYPHPTQGPKYLHIEEEEREFGNPEGWCTGYWGKVGWLCLKLVRDCLYPVRWPTMIMLFPRSSPTCTSHWCLPNGPLLTSATVCSLVPLYYVEWKQLAPRQKPI